MTAMLVEAGMEEGIEHSPAGPCTPHQDDEEGTSSPLLTPTSPPASPCSQQRARFRTLAGIQISRVWLRDCVAHLRRLRREQSRQSQPQSQPQSQQLSQARLEAEEDGGGGGDDDDVWNQVLHADLRHVVRDDQLDAKEACDAAVQLREAIEASLHPVIATDVADGGANSSGDGTSGQKYQSKYKSTLPANFRLLIQMEELVDVTMNADQRLAAMGPSGLADSSHPPAARNAAQNFNGEGNFNGNRNPRYRCLKMVFSDGFYSDGTSFQTPDEGEQSINSPRKDIMPMAMETSPIPNLSLQSPPGLKLLLHGPIVVRYGMLQIHDGNCLVIGGRVAEWHQLWKMALDKAKKESGHGVDPTIKALIWNPLTGNEEEIDEGEGESRDIPVALPPSAVNPPSTTVSPPDRAATVVNRNSSTFAQNGPSARLSQTFNQTPNQSSNQTSNQTSNRASFATARVSTHSQSNGGNVTLSNNNPYQRNTAATSTTVNTTGTNSTNAPDSHGFNTRNASNLLNNNPNGFRAASSIVSTDDFASTSPQQHNSKSSTTNPYASLRPSFCTNATNTHANVTTNTSSSSTPKPILSTLSHPSAQSKLPYARNTESHIDLTDSPKSASSLDPPTNNSLSANPTATPRPVAQRKGSVRSSSAIDVDTAQNTSKAADNANDNITTTNSSLLVSPTSTHIILSFCELKSLLITLRQSKSSYEQHYGKTFVVPCKMSALSEDKVFNIKRVKKSKEKKYEFLLVSPFYGEKESYGGIACRVESTLLEQYFEGKTPGDIRKISREDKVRGRQLVNDKTTQFVADFSSLANNHMKLSLLPSEFFDGKFEDKWLEDVNRPVLMVVRRVN